MQQPWIHKAKTDSIFILSPSFLVVSIVFLFQKQLQQIETKYSFYTWLFLIVFIDVAHVYATFIIRKTKSIKKQNEKYIKN